MRAARSVFAYPKKGLSYISGVVDTLLVYLLTIMKQKYVSCVTLNQIM